MLRISKLALIPDPKFAIARRHAIVGSSTLARPGPESGLREGGAFTL